MTAGRLQWQVPRVALLLYALLCLALSLSLLLLSLQQGKREFAAWLVAYGGIVVLSLRRPEVAPLAGAAAALLLGFTKTYRSGVDLDLGLSLIAAAIGLHMLDRWRRTAGSYSVDLAGLLLFFVAIWSMVSLGFSLARIGTFTPAPGFSFHWYRFNPQGLASDEAMIRATIGATSVLTWFGLYEFARAARLSRRNLNVVLFLLLLANGIALLVQGHVDPGFLHPIGFPQQGRLNGLTSFAYALGDVVLALFLLLPAWGVWHGRRRILTVGSLALLAHATITSGSRTALFTCLLAAVLWACLRALRLIRARRRAVASLVLVAVTLVPCLVAVAYWMTPANLATPLGRIKDEVERDGAFSLVAGRLSSYPLNYRVMRAYPLAGVGLGLYPVEVAKQHALLAADVEILHPYLLTSYAPNQIVNTGVELGVPAMIALVAVLVFAAVRSLPGRGSRGSADLAVSLFALAVALQVGPSFYNSEALVFLWLLIGLAAQAGSGTGTALAELPGGRTVGVRGTSAMLTLAAVVGVAGQWLALPSLAIDRQWKRLRWPMNIGMKAPEEGGRWTAPEATFTVRTSARELVVRWHAGDPVQTGYRAVVSFYVDGELAEKSVALSGRIRETVLPLPAVPGLKRVSVKVSPPFVPADAGGGGDSRQLGIFIHSVRPAPDGSRGP